MVVYAEVLDYADIVHMLPTKVIRTSFNDNAVCVCMPYIRRRLHTVNRLDIEWDRYINHSTKQNIRESVGIGQRRRVVVTTPLPRNWLLFIRVDFNKEELFNFLTDHIRKETPPDGKERCTPWTQV